MNLLLSFSSWFEGDSVSVAWAMIGGLIVATGLAIEKVADFLDENFLGGYKAHKIMGLIGWYILMLGIFVEIADAGWAAHEIKNVQDAANKNAPENRPITEVHARVFLQIIDTNFLDAANATVKLCDTNGGGIGLFPLTVDSFSMNNGWLFLDLSAPPFVGSDIRNFRNKVGLIDSVRILKINGTPFWHRKIFTGRAVLEFNSEKRFFVVQDTYVAGLPPDIVATRDPRFEPK